MFRTIEFRIWYAFLHKFIYLYFTFAPKVWDKDLKFKREIPIHKDYAVIALVLNEQKQIYSSGRDGTLRFLHRPWSHDHNDIILQSVTEDVTALAICDDTLYSGDDKGIVSKWYHTQVASQYNVLEEVKSMAVEGIISFKWRMIFVCSSFLINIFSTFHLIGFRLYTVRELDVVITDINPRMKSNTTNGTFSGHYPLLLVGPEYSEKHKKFIVAATRDGKGIVVADNNAPYKIITTKNVCFDFKWFYLSIIFFIYVSNNVNNFHYYEIESLFC